MCVRVWDQVIVHGCCQVIDQMIRELFTFHLHSNEELKYNVCAVCMCVCVSPATHTNCSRIILLVN